MGKFFSISKNQGAVLSTILVLILLGASYFFLYIPKNEKTVQERHFRCLQNIDYNIHSKIETSITFIDTLLLSMIHKTITIDSLNNYISHYSKDGFTLLHVDTIQIKKDADSLDKVNATADLKKNTLTVTKGTDTVGIKQDLDSLDEVNATADLNKFILTVTREKDTHNKTKKLYYEIGIKYNIKQFIKPLLIKGVFDHYVVFYNNKDNENKGTNKVVFETFPSGLSYLKKDSLLQAKNGIITPGIRSLSLSGTDYKVFTQAINIDATSEFIVAGLVSDKNYQKEKNQLPLWIVLLLLTAAFGMIVLLPWIKLYHMGNKDKLTVADAVSSVLVSMLLMSLLFFVLFKYSFSLHFNSNYKPSFSSSNSLANKITVSMGKELDSAYKLLNIFDRIHDSLPKNIIYLEKKTVSYDKGETPNGDSKKYDFLKNCHCITSKESLIMQEKNVQDIAVREVLWLDTSGKEKENWNTEKYNAPHIKYNRRDYFIDIKKNKFNKSDTPQFYIDQVVSKTRSVFTSVIAKKTRHTSEPIAAMTFTVKSLDSVVMPDGYQFAVIDDRGEVRYHSLPQRNLNENLRYEFADSSKLVSCLEAKSDTTFKAEYYGKQYNIKIKPFPNLPYFIVIFEDLEYNDAQNTEPYSFTLSMLICFMVFVAIQFCVVFLVSSKRSFFKKQMFDTSWIAPNKKSRRQYNLAIIANGIIIMLLIIFYGFSSFLGYLYILLFSTTFIAIFLTGNFAIKYKKRKDPRYSFKFSAVLCLCLFVMLIDYAAFETLDNDKNFYILILYELLSAAFCTSIYIYGPYLLVRARKHINNLSPNLSPNWNYINSFALMITTRLIITSGIPVAFLFIYSFNYEQKLDTRYRQLNFAKSMTGKIPLNYNNILRMSGSKFVSHGKKSKTNQDSLSIPGVYPDGLFIKTIELDSNYHGQFSKAAAATLHTAKEDNNTVNIFSAFRLLINNTELKSNNMSSDSVGNVAVFNKITNDSITTCTYKVDPNKNIRCVRLTSGNINYPLSQLWFLPMLLLIIILLTFYYIILNIIKKIFALNLPAQNGWEKMDEKLLLGNELNRLLLIVGPPGSGKLSKLKKMICEGKLYCNEKKSDCKKDGLDENRKNPLVLESDDPSEINVFIADMILISAEAGEEYPAWEEHKKEALNDHALIIINHFEYNIKDFRANRIKLDFLESLMQRAVSKIIIISAVHPLTFLDSFNEQQSGQAPNPIQSNLTPNQQQNSPAANQPHLNRIPESELERWHVLLGHFRIIIEPLENSPYIHYDTDILKRSIFEETQYAHYLTKMQQITLDTLPSVYNKNLDMTSDSMIFKLQITSHYFYTYIWQSLTMEEKFLLYDLAEDGLVNPYDDYNLSMLISKGLVIKRAGILTLFNKGFRNFILTAIGNAEVNRIKAQVKDNGNWGSLKAPLTLAILAILIFLITSQEEAYTRIITYVTALGAGIPAVLRIFSMFGNGRTQKTS